MVLQQLKIILIRVLSVFLVMLLRSYTLLTPIRSIFVAWIHF